LVPWLVLLAAQSPLEAQKGHCFFKSQHFPSHFKVRLSLGLAASLAGTGALAAFLLGAKDLNQGFCFIGLKRSIDTGALLGVAAALGDL
jgi:hypothetical protein